MAESLGFRIREVSALTGVPADSIRAWEKRYGAVAPARDETNVRIYSERDVARLKLIKQLVDRGARISDVAALDEAELSARLEQMGPVRIESPNQTVPVAVVGPDLLERIRALPGNEFDVVAAVADLDEWADAYVPPGTTILVHYDVMLHDRIKRMLQTMFSTAPRMILLVYQFAPHELIDEFSKRGVIPVRALGSSDELRHALLSHHYWQYAGRDDEHRFLNDPIPPLRFSDADLERARRVSTPLACECPTHLADLITTLKAFEDFSAQCESLTPKDAATHAMLKSAGGHARGIIESALLRLAEDDDILDQILGEVPLR